MKLKEALFLIVAVVCQEPTWCFTPGQSCLTPNMTVHENVSCATYLICDVINHIWTRRLCAYPDLYSTVSNRCENFGTVECKTRNVPMTPCGYIITCRRTPSNGCTCENHELYGDLDWSYCMGKSDGNYPYPERPLSPFFVQCKQNRTIPTRCPVLGHVIFDHYDRTCRYIFDVITQQRASTKAFSTPARTSGPIEVNSSSSSLGVAAVSSTSIAPEGAAFGLSSPKPRLGAMVSSNGLDQKAFFSSSTAPKPLISTSSATKDAHAAFDLSTTEMMSSTKRVSLSGTDVEERKTFDSRRTGTEVVLKGSKANRLQSDVQRSYAARERADSLRVTIGILMSFSLHLFK